LIFKLEVLFVNKQQSRETEQINDQGQSDDDWTEKDSDQSIDGVLSFVVLSLVVELDEN
jgi:hypothetical protein